MYSTVWHFWPNSIEDHEAGIPDDLQVSLFAPEHQIWLITNTNAVFIDRSLEVTCNTFSLLLFLFFTIPICSPQPLNLVSI